MPSYLGQNFLIDNKVRVKIFELIKNFANNYSLSKCIEIGPGKGSITKKILNHFSPKDILLIEKDKDFFDIIYAFDVNIIREDVLSVGYDQLDNIGFNPKNSIVYGSLPYYITSPIISQFMLNWGYCYGIFITQLEFGLKIASDAKKKSYLWRLLNNFFDIKICKIIGPKSFLPAPRVDSCIISFTKLSQNILDISIYQKMLILLDKISKYKRKTISKSMKMAGYTIDIPYGYKRLEELAWEEMRDLVMMIG